MSMQYVEIESAPERRHILKAVINGKGKKGGRQALTVCGQPFSVEEAAKTPAAKTPAKKKGRKS